MIIFCNFLCGRYAVSISIILFGIISFSVASQLIFDPHDLQFQIGDGGHFVISLSSRPNETFHVDLIQDKSSIIVLSTNNVSFGEDTNQSLSVYAKGVSPGSLVVWANASVDYYDDSQAFIRIKVKVYGYLDIISDVIGWMYFVAWSISFYPQIWLNLRRRSVAGLHLDFLALNIAGFISYSVFNCGLLFNKEIQDEYFQLHPRGVNPVQLNDVVFALHALLACLVTGVQAVIFEREEQRVSHICVGFLGLAVTFIIVSFVLVLKSMISWLTFLYYFSYVKLAITIVKYVPQAFFNFRRKSTKGWSIGNILFDFTGGGLSLLQMFIIAYNYDDWSSIFGDPTKFGLGFFSILFDILFMVQHYVLYRSATDVARSPYKIMTSSVSCDDVVCDGHQPHSYQDIPDKNDNV